MTLSTLNVEEVEKFSRLAAQWWDPQGEFRPLHQLNPLRIQYIREQVLCFFKKDLQHDGGEVDRTPFKGLTLLDIGCGGGLLSEPMCRLGADVMGVDASEKNIHTALTHAKQSGLDIHYQVSTAEDLEKTGIQFDIILNMEVIEHVDHPDLFFKACSSMLKPNGLMIVATLNRTISSFMKAIIGAEYILGWLPQGTHNWKHFFKPEEIQALAERNHLTLQDRRGMVYALFSGQWSFSQDERVNYLMTFAKRLI
jgi:2-polyprenyl-6-hydroxyphenyl methylase / 3-demethylubiquinone-9 3-methyltransferase